MSNAKRNEMKNLKNQILRILTKKAANYDNSNINFYQLLAILSCSEEELIICINGSQDARIENTIDL